MSTPYTTGSLTPFNPDALLDSWNPATDLPPAVYPSSSSQPSQPSHPSQPRSFSELIRTLFALPEGDDYVYHAHAAVTLAQAEEGVQKSLEGKGKLGWDRWYREVPPETTATSASDASTGRPAPLVLRPPPPPADITAYTTLFHPASALLPSLTSLSANAKPRSIRADVAAHLHHELRLNSTHTPPLPLRKKPKRGWPAMARERRGSFANPALDIWAWCCGALGWAGPVADTEGLGGRVAHPVLPVLYHHFGCAVPSAEALGLIARLAADSGGREVLDVGSGNGYWTYLLRRCCCGGGVDKVTVTVTPVDDGASSVWRTMWVGDTVRVDGVAYLRSRKGAPGTLLLLVYPPLGGEFFPRVLRAFAGETVVVVGTQNRNGFTGVKGMTVREWVERREQGNGGMGGWVLRAQLPMPSFAGKDEGVFVFGRRREGEGEGGGEVV